MLKCVMLCGVLLLAVPSLSMAQGLMQRAAVGSCQAVDNGSENEFQGASYLVPSNTPGTEFWCPIDAALAPPAGITSVTAWVGDHSHPEEASLQVCVTNLNATPNETCGKPVYASGYGYFAQALTAYPPPIKMTKTHVAFIKVFVPQPNPAGYSFFRGFRVD